MTWDVDFHDAFVAEYHALPRDVQDELLGGGDKSGGSERRFYMQLIARADARFDAHLTAIKKQNDKEGKPRR